MAAKICWDSWELVQEALSEGRAGKGLCPLVAVMWAQKWNPPALSAAESLETLRSKGESGLQIFVVDKDEHAAKALEFDIVACPALCMFWKGEAMTVRRCFRADSNKYVGSVKKDTWRAIIDAGLAVGPKYDKGAIQQLVVHLEH